MPQLNTVRPFYIKKTSDITRQQVQDALDKCVSLGAIASERYSEVETTIEYDYLITTTSEYLYFGVAANPKVEIAGTALHDYKEYFGPDAIEITLDQLDEHLGIKQETPWSGEVYPPVGTECEISNCGQAWEVVVIKFIGKDFCVVMYGDEEYCHPISDVKFRPLETSEQKKELEAAYDLYCDFADGMTCKTFESFINNESTSKKWIRVVRKTNYRVK